MATLNIPLPDDIRNALPIGEEELAVLALEALLLRLYERGNTSSGKAIVRLSQLVPGPQARAILEADAT